jgi:hypothetical protein
MRVKVTGAQGIWIRRSLLFVILSKYYSAMKLRRIRWEGHVIRMREKKTFKV